MNKICSLLYFLFSLFCVFVVKAQNIEVSKGVVVCGSNSGGAMQVIYSKVPQTFMPFDSKTNMRLAATIYKLPVVVHVITPNECEDVSSLRYKNYPSDELIRYELNETSQGFRHTHSRARTYTNPYYGIDTEIEVALATIDPNGHYTSGIERIADPAIQVINWEALYPLIDKYKWDTQKYCNIFVVKGMTNASGVFIDGNDFTIFSANAFWSGLLNHELGHYLGLNHTFESENGSCPTNTNCLTSGDHICDTPPKYTAGSLDELCKGDIFNTCSSDEADLSLNNPYRPVSLGGMGDQPDMITNYMDYGGSCWDSYTLGQKNRMRSIIENKLGMLAFSTSAFSNPTPAFYLHGKFIDLVKDGCTGLYIPKVLVENRGSTLVTSLIVKILDNGSSLSQIIWTGSLAPGQTIEISLPGLNITNHLYLLKVAFENPNNQVLPIYQTGSCRQFNFIDFYPANPLNISFATCNISDLGRALNDVNLRWSVESYPGYAGYSCHLCAAVLLSKSSSSYAIQKASFELPSRDFTHYDKPALNFKLGYLPNINSGPFDTLSVKVLAGCNVLKNIWEGTGLELATNNPPSYNTDNNIFYYPNCNQYKDVSIDLGLFAGKKDVRILIEARGKFMSSLFIDDILIDNNILVGIPNETEERAIHFTNPVIDELLIKSTTTSGIFRILNVTGQVILETSNTQISVSKLNPGLYFLVWENNNKRTIHKFLKL
jgi:hypothetical protein